MDDDYFPNPGSSCPGCRTFDKDPTKLRIGKQTMKALIEWAQEYRGNVRPMDDDEPRFDDLLLEKAAAEDLLEACGDDDQATPT